MSEREWIPVKYEWLKKLEDGTRESKLRIIMRRPKGGAGSIDETFYFEEGQEVACGFDWDNNVRVKSHDGTTYVFPAWSVVEVRMASNSKQVSWEEAFERESGCDQEPTTTD